MGLYDWKHWLVLLVVVLVVFGGKRLRGLGADLGESIKGFRRSLESESQAPGNAGLGDANDSAHEKVRPRELTGSGNTPA
ncbi:Sec-independent protein translocase protein TatA [compost metagenome]